MDNSGNRLYLNFGDNNERLAPTDRTYPTTPSTFPQPVFQSGSSAQPQTVNPGAQPQAQPYSQGGYTSANYYGQNQYPQQYSSQLSAQAGEYPSANQGYSQARANTPGTSNDPNTGLAHQFSHQNLGGGAARPAPYGSRGPSPAQRPRTAGATNQQAGYGNYLNAPLPTPSPQLEFAPAPERNPDKYGPNANNNQKKCSQLASDFFKDSVKRARERNQR